MLNQFSRTELLFGKDAMEKLNNSSVIVFGVGGVGGYVVEALARSGVGNITLVDNDKVSLTNINRQIIATLDSVGKYKCDIMKERILSINPNCNVTVFNMFFLPESKDLFDFSSYDYVIDAIDTVAAKIAIIECAIASNCMVISSMGTGNKLNPSMLEVADIYDTKVDPLAKVMRLELKKRKIKKLKVVYSKERALKPIYTATDLAEIKEGSLKRSIPGSNSFVPPAAGLLIASEVIKDLTNIRNDVMGA